MTGDAKRVTSRRLGGGGFTAGGSADVDMTPLRYGGVLRDLAISLVRGRMKIQMNATRNNVAFLL